MRQVNDQASLEMFAEIFKEIFTDRTAVSVSQHGLVVGLSSGEIFEVFVIEEDGKYGFSFDVKGSILKEELFVTGKEPS